MSCLVRRVLSLMILCAALVAGCSWKEQPQQDGMSVVLDFSDVHRCSRISPEIIITNPPRETAYYEVRLIRVQDKRFHGGGIWTFDGVDEDGIDSIPEGALISHYRAPCPEAGKAEEYMLSVSAMPGNNIKEPLAVSYYTFTVQ